MPEVSDTDVFDHSMDATSRQFTKLLHRVVPPGVYHGMELVKEGSIVHILAGVAVVRDAQGHQTTVIAETTKSVEPTEDDNIILIDWEYQNDPDNQAQILVSSVSTNTDVVLGKAVFDNNGNFDSVTQSNRDLPTWTKNPGQADEENMVLIPEINDQ